VERKKAYINGLVNFRKLLRRRTPSGASLSPRKKYACVCFLQKSETVIEEDACNVWIKTSFHINTEQAEGRQKRGSKEEEEET
jgi:hypothetical protein